MMLSQSVLTQSTARALGLLSSASGPIRKLLKNSVWCIIAIDSTSDPISHMTTADPCSESLSMCLGRYLGFFQL